MADTVAPTPQTNQSEVKGKLDIVNNPIGYICIGSSVGGYFVAKHYNKSKVAGVVIGFFSPLIIMAGIFIMAGKKINVQ